MAGFGAFFPRFAEIENEPESSLPTYKKDPVTIGRLIGANRTVQHASGEIYGDNVLAEKVVEFVSAEIAMETVDILDDVAAKIYGAEVVNKEVIYKGGDSPPAGGLGYIQNLKRNKKEFFKGLFYPKVQAQMGAHSAQTKGGTISFGTSSTTFTVFETNTGVWLKTKEFETEKAAKDWVDKQLGVSASGGSSGGAGGSG